MMRYNWIFPSSIADTRIALSDAFSITISGHNFVLRTNLKFPWVLATFKNENDIHLLQSSVDFKERNVKLSVKDKQVHILNPA